MTISITIESLKRLFPALFIVDGLGHVVDTGSAITNLVPLLRLGDRLSDHFRFGSHTDAIDWENLGYLDGQAIELRSLTGPLLLIGTLIRENGQYLFAVNPATATLESGTFGEDASSATRLQISDFSPGDPAVDVLLLVSMQKAMLNDAAALATSLAKEQQRNDGMLDRVSRVSGYLAHDFNNILSVIQLNAKRLAMLAGIDPQAERLAAIISAMADRGSGITGSLMTISKENTESPSQWSADKLITRHLSYFAAIAGSEIPVTAQLGAPDAYIAVSISEFINCLTNLVINSRDAISPPGAIKISTRPVDPSDGAGGPMLEIVIADTGQGMTPETVAQAFEPFFSTKQHGTGIGLSSVLAYVREAGGTARIHSQPGMGTRVALYFPLVALDDRAQLPLLDEWSPSQPRPTSPTKSSHQAVLLVEDEPYALEALEELLELEGYEVWPARNADEAMRKLEAAEAEGATPDILLTDVVLPLESGIELATRIAARVADIRIILMSGFVPAGQTIAPDWHFAPKPLDPEKLLRSLRN